MSGSLNTPLSASNQCVTSYPCLLPNPGLLLTLPPPPPPAVPSASQTVQAASEAAASTLMDSCGAENAPWKDPRWSTLLPEEKVR